MVVFLSALGEMRWLNVSTDSDHKLIIQPNLARASGKDIVPYVAPEQLWMNWIFKPNFIHPLTQASGMSLQPDCVTEPPNI